GADVAVAATCSPRPVAAEPEAAGLSLLPGTTRNTTNSVAAAANTTTPVTTLPTRARRVLVGRLTGVVATVASPGVTCSRAAAASAARAAFMSGRNAGSDCNSCPSTGARTPAAPGGSISPVATR